MFITAPINNLSYGLVSRYLIEELSKLTKTNTYPIGPVNSSEELVINSINDLVESPVNINSPSLKIWHQFDLFQHIGKGKRIAYTFFELDTLTKRDIVSLESQDLVLVASNWAKSVISKHCRVQCEVINLGVKQSIFNICDNTSYNNFVFLNIGKMEYRKGHDILLKAASKVFKDKNDVVLWMMADNKFTDISKNVNEYKRLLGNKVAFLNPVKNHKDIANVINMSHCGIYPYRSEGWCMPLSESMSCGIPVIATNYSSPTDYLNPNDTIEPDGIERAVDNIFFHGEGNWAYLGEKYLDKLVEKMEFHYTEWKRGNFVKNKTFSRDWSKVASEIYERVS